MNKTDATTTKIQYTEAECKKNCSFHHLYHLSVKEFIAQQTYGKNEEPVD